MVVCLYGAAWGQSVPEVAKPSVPANANAAGGAAADPLVAAKALFNKSKFADAATAFRALVEKDPSSPEAQAGLVRSLLRAHKVDEADDAGRRALTAVPASALVHAAVGDAAFRAGRFPDAEAEYRAALKADPNSARGTFGMARMMEMVSMRKSAKAAYAKAHELDPEDQQIFYAWVDSLTYNEQLEILKKAAGDHPAEHEQERLKLLSAVAQRKPWVLVSEIRPTEIKMPKYGRGLVRVFNANSEGARSISHGYALDVKFNDRISATLLLDTGAGGIVLGRKLAEKAGVVRIANTYLGGIGDKGPIQGYFGWVDKLNIGSLEFHNCLVRVSSENDVVDESGLIGANVFNKFVVTLDFAEQKMLLVPLPTNPNVSGSEDDLQDRYIAPEMAGFTRVWQFGHHLVIPVVVSDKATGNFILDTGAGLNSVTPRLASQVTKLSNEGARIRGISGSVKEVLSGDKTILQFAKIRVRSDDIPVFDFGSSNADGTEIAGLIGIRTLTQMKMTIDYRDGLVNLEVYEFRKARE